MVVFRRKGYTPKPGERQIGHIRPRFDADLDKSIKRKSEKLRQQGKVGLGFRSDVHFNDFGNPQTGIPIGKKEYYFELRNGEPIVSGTLQHHGSITAVNRTFKGTAKARAEFARLPVREREIILRKVKAELKTLPERAYGEVLPEVENELREKKELKRMERPSRGLYENFKSGLKYAKSVMELDVVWETYSENDALRKLLQEYYEKRRKKLESQGKIEPE